MSLDPDEAEPFRASQADSAGLRAEPTLRGPNVGTPHSVWEAKREDRSWREQILSVAREAQELLNAFDATPLDQMTPTFYAHAYNEYDLLIRELVHLAGDEGAAQGREATEEPNDQFAGQGRTATQAPPDRS